MSSMSLDGYNQAFPLIIRHASATAACNAEFALVPPAIAVITVVVSNSRTTRADWSGSRTRISVIRIRRRVLRRWRRIPWRWRRIPWRGRRILGRWRRILGRWRRILGRWRRVPRRWRRIPGRWRRVHRRWRSRLGIIIPEETARTLYASLRSARRAEIFLLL
jgi:hypothetical protein